MENLMYNTDFGELCKSKSNIFKIKLEYLLWYELTRSKFDSFLKQPLSLEMFVPCNLECKPYKYDDNTGHNAYDREYRQAKNRCLFDGFELVGETESYYHLIYDSCFTFLMSKKDNSTIESIINKEFKLTATALKQIGL